MVPAEAGREWLYFGLKMGVGGKKSHSKGLKSVKGKNNSTKKMYFCV